MSTTFARAKSAAPLEKDRRRSERRPHVVEAFVWSPTATDPNDREEVTSIDLSRHGLAFNLTHELPTGAFYMTEIAIGDQKILAEVRIISCRATDDGAYQVGAEFC